MLPSASGEIETDRYGEVRSPSASTLKYGRLRSRTPQEFERELLTAWTQKEATLKAMGSGLLIDPRRVETEPICSDRCRVRVCVPGAEGTFLARSVNSAGHSRSWVGSVATPDVPRAHRASLRIVRVA